MKLVILGATGGLGSRLAHYFQDQKYAVLAQGRNPEKLNALKSQGILCIEGALNDTQVLNAVTTFAPDCIINATGKSGFSRGKAQYAKANIETVDHAIALAQAAKNCRLIHFSSPSVSYRAHDCLEITEDKPFSPPVSGYAWSRQQSELLLQATDDLPITIVRLRSAYGYGAPSPLEAIRQKIVKRSFVPLVRGGDVKIDLIHMDDVLGAVDAILNISQPIGKLVLNVAGPDALTFGHIVEVIGVHENVIPRWLPIPGIALAIAGPIAEIMMLFLNENREPDISAHMAGSLLYSQTLDLSRIKALTGWSPRISLAEALYQKRV
jgi:nucleoside-diphosphate-sugar epimerase